MAGQTIHSYVACCEPNQLGRIHEAKAEMQDLRTARPNLTVRVAQKIYIYLADRDDFFGAMRQAGLPD